MVIFAFIVLSLQRNGIFLSQSTALCASPLSYTKLQGKARIPPMNSGKVMLLGKSQISGSMPINIVYFKTSFNSLRWRLFLCGCGLQELFLSYDIQNGHISNTLLGPYICFCFISVTYYLRFWRQS